VVVTLKYKCNSQCKSIIIKLLVITSVYGTTGGRVFLIAAPEDIIKLKLNVYQVNQDNLKLTFLKLQGVVNNLFLPAGLIKTLTIAITTVLIATGSHL